MFQVMKKLLTAVAFISYICQCSSQKYYYKFQDPYKNSLSVYNGQSAPDDYKELESPNSYKADHLINEGKSLQYIHSYIEPSNLYGFLIKHIS